jgi:glucose/arabinose dehydrogenase/mono/diheme cytochrome c family protein
MMRKIVIGLVGLGLALALACSFLLPDGLVVKGPILNSITGRSIAAPEPETVERRFVVAPGYRVELFAEGIQNARFLRFSPGGSLVVSQPRLGRLLRVERDLNGDGRSDGQHVLLEGLDRPHGFDFGSGQLFIGEGGAIARVAFEESGPDTLHAIGGPARIVEGLPEGENHWTRTVRIGPDGMLYLTIGSSCNVCIEKDPRRAAMMRYAIDGTSEEIYAAGLRNSVGFDWRPGTTELYATENGRDLLGDDTPPCELNRIERAAFYGWPYAYGDNQPDPDFGKGQPARIRASLPPVHAFGAHQAPLGITFLRSASQPADYRGAALVALHGSWNRSELSGYKVVSLHWDADGRISQRDFLSGFLTGDDVIGRPVDVAEGPDGAIYVSDDYAAAIYRITRSDASHPAARLESARPTPRAVDDPLAEYDADTRQAMVERGATLFAERACAGCHVEGQAEPGVVVKPIEGLAARYTVKSLAAFLKTPQPPMPVVELPDADRMALAAHLLDQDTRARNTATR